MGEAGEGPLQPFYLRAGRGVRFCVYHPAPGEARGAILYVPPFAEEMNKSRRMAALQSRLLRAQGYAVLQIDLYGTGDSDGELRDATWTVWKHDLAVAVCWLAARHAVPVFLWGLRLGALLALDFARESGSYAGYLLWQPVVSGEAHLTQFLRVSVAASAAGRAGPKSTRELRAALGRGVTVEVGGYEITPGLAAAIDALRLDELAPRRGAVHWLEVVAPDAGKPPGAQRIVDAWTVAGMDLVSREVVGEPFWSTAEIATCPELLDATVAALAAVTA